MASYNLVIVHVSTDVWFKKGNFAVYNYRSFIVRRYLEADDWNDHLHLSVATKKAGEQLFSGEYNQQTKQWDQKLSKLTRGMISLPIAKTFHARMPGWWSVCKACITQQKWSTFVGTNYCCQATISHSRENFNCCSRSGLPSESSEEMKAEEDSSSMEHWLRQRVAKELWFRTLFFLLKACCHIL